MILIFGAYRLWVVKVQSDSAPKPAPVGLALAGGGAIGFVAGLTGIGGGIFLSPLLIMMHWATTRQTAGISVAFILVNSIAGLVGLFLKGGPKLPSAIWWWAVAAVLGGFLGSTMGSRKFSDAMLRRVLAAVLVVAALKLLWI